LKLLWHVAAEMRVVLFLTVGIPVFAAQLVAFALPRVESAHYTLLRRVAETTERAEVESKVVQPARPLPPIFAFIQVADDGFVAAPAPEDSSARALLFVKHVRRQAT
jgi:uncharacterized Fe-S cluster-containing protein